MPQIDMRTTGAGGEFGDVLARYPRASIVNMEEDIPLRVELIDGGMAGGKPAVTLVLELPMIGRVVVARTSVKLFQVAACASWARYGDMTGGALTGFITPGLNTATVTIGEAIACAGCGREIAKTRFCPHCGAKPEPREI